MLKISSVKTGGGAHYLPRLAREFYRGDAVVHWTMATINRQSGWLTAPLHQRFRELMLHAAAREGLLCPAYCLMPDHLHLLWLGLRADSDQRNGMAFLRTQLGPALAPARLQPQAYDHVLGEAERKRNAFSATADYILHNPVRAGLVPHPRDWPHSGAVLPGYPQLHPCADNYWPLFWRLYHRARQPDTAQRVRPLRSVRPLPPDREST